MRRVKMPKNHFCENLVRHEACVNRKQIPTWMKEPCNQICRSG